MLRDNCVSAIDCTRGSPCKDALPADADWLTCSTHGTHMYWCRLRLRLKAAGQRANLGGQALNELGPHVAALASGVAWNHVNGPSPAVPEHHYVGTLPDPLFR